MNEQDEFNRRRRQRAIVTALLLVGLVALFYFITLAKISAGEVMK